MSSSIASLAAVSSIASKAEKSKEVESPFSELEKEVAADFRQTLLDYVTVSK